MLSKASTKRPNADTNPNSCLIVHKQAKFQISLSSSAKTLVCQFPTSPATMPDCGPLQSEKNGSADTTENGLHGSTVIARNPEKIEEPKRNLCATEVQSKNDKKLIMSNFEVLHVTEEDEPTYIVRNLVKNEFNLCREIGKEKYDHYVSIRKQLNKFFTLKINDEKIEEKIWPRDLELFNFDKDKLFYIVSPRHYGSLHSYVIDKKKLTEAETYLFYHQILQIVAFCHERGIVLRDVKLRKFVFVDEHRRKIRLDDVDEVMVCETIDDDSLSDRHGCPAYVSPEILDLSKKYSGKSADVWSLGVLLYVMLMGRYPFYDSTPSGLFEKICSANVSMNDQCGLSLELRLLIRCLLRKLPHERPTVHDILAHPWLTRNKIGSKFQYGDTDQENELPTVFLPTTRRASLPIVLDSNEDQNVP